MNWELDPKQRESGVFYSKSGPHGPGSISPASVLSPVWRQVVSCAKCGCLFLRFITVWGTFSYCRISHTTSEEIGGNVVASIMAPPRRLDTSCPIDAQVQLRHMALPQG